MSYRGTLFGGVVFLGTVWLAAGGSAALGQERNFHITAGPYSGTVVDPAGRPAAGVKIWIVAGAGPFVFPVGATTGPQGQFRVAETEANIGPFLSPPTLVARDPQGRIGGTRYLSRPEDNIVIKLVDARDYRGRLVNSSGRAIANAVIKPLHWSSVGVVEGFKGYTEAPATLLLQSGTRTAADGAFLLHALPTLGKITLAITAPGFGSQEAVVGLGRPVTIRLRHPGTIRGSVTCANDQSALAGLRIRFLTEPRPENENEDAVQEGCLIRFAKPDGTSSGWSEREGHRFQYYKDVVSGKDGSFGLDDVPPGKYMLEVQHEERLPFYAEWPRQFQVKPNETTSVSVVLRPALKVKGKVVDKQSGGGIAGVHLRLNSSIERGDTSTSRTGSDIQRGGVTDAQGAFTIYCKPSNVIVSVDRCPQRYIQPPMFGFMPFPPSLGPWPIEITKDTTLPPIELERVNPLEGMVVDPAGRPVANARIHYIEGGPHFGESREIAFSDAAGKFSLAVSGEKTVVVRARTGNAVADPLKVTPAEAKAPIRLVVSEKKAFSIHGLVVENSGQPLKDVTVNLQTTWHFEDGSLGFRLDAHETDAKGQFVFSGLWPGDGYSLRISAEGRDQYVSHEVRGKPGKLHDFGKIVLARSRQTVASAPTQRRVPSTAAYYSYGVDQVFETTITEEAIRSSPPWPAGQESPPLSGRRAISIADREKAKLVKDGNGWAWHLASAALIPHKGERWYWLITYGADRAGQLGGRVPYLRLVVLMDGKPGETKAMKGAPVPPVGHAQDPFRAFNDWFRERQRQELLDPLPAPTPPFSR